MILLINICKEKLHFYEFVKPVGDVLARNGIKGFIKHYACLKKLDLKKADKIIICGTSLKDNGFLKDVRKFEWIKTCEKPVLGICGGAHVIGLVKGEKLKRKKEMDFRETEMKGFLGVGGKRKVYHLHNFEVLPEVFQEKNFHATLFHPEVRNKDLILKFARL